MSNFEGFPRGRAAIAGLATYGMGEAPGSGSLELAAQAALAALDDCGASLSEVDGVFACLPDDVFGGLALAEYLGLAPRYTDCNRTGGSAFMSHVAVASMMLADGLIDIALIAYGSNQRTAGRKLSTPAKSNRFEAPYRPLFPISSYALAASRHFHDFGTTRRQLAEVAVAAREWAIGNPEAFKRKPMSLDEVLAARMVSSPLSTKDCCLVTDGAAAIVLMRSDRALGGPKSAVPVLGAAAATHHYAISQMPDLTSTAAVLSGQRAYQMAGVGPADIDVVELYDAFTINTLLFLEDLGFCKKGEGGPFVESGRIAPGGSLAVNTNGGGLSCGHPGMYGLFAIVEAARQIRGEAANQLPKVDVALAHGNGLVLSSQATVILGSIATL